MMLLQRHTGGGRWCDVITESYRGWGGVMSLQRHTGGGVVGWCYYRDIQGVGWCDVITETYRGWVG